MLKRMLLLALAATSLALVARAEPAIKVINFTADWCPNCLILNPRLDEAIATFDAEDIALVPVDMTDLRGKGEDVKWQTIDQLKELTLQHDVRYLWDWYGGYTGIAIIVAADNGEPLSCINRVLEVDDIAARLNEGVILATKGVPGQRMPMGPDCPPPMRPQR